MKADIIPLIIGLLIFLSSLISLKIGISVAVIEIIFGVTAGILDYRLKNGCYTLPVSAGLS